MKITPKFLVLLLLICIFNAKAQQIKFPDNFKISLSVLPGYKVTEDAVDNAKAKNAANGTTTDILYTQRFESADKKNTIDVFVYQLTAEGMFNEQGFIERLQLMQGYLQMINMGAFEFLKVKNYLIQLQSITPKAINKNIDKALVTKLSNYYKKKLGAVTIKIPPVQQAGVASQNTNSSANSPDYTNLKRWVANNFGPSFYQQYIQEGSGRLNVLLNIDGQGKTTVKEIKGTSNEKLINAIKDKISKMPIWSKAEAAYSSTINLPLDFKKVEE